MGPTIGGVVLVFAVFGAWCAYHAFVDWLNERRGPAPEEPECKHEWEPWSEPKETDVRSTTRSHGVYSSSDTVTKDYVGKFQERVCSRCNIYQRRWC